MSNPSREYKRFQKHVAELLKQESSQPKHYIYMSFAHQEFLGGVIVKAKGFTHARLSLATHGIKSPGGEILFWDIPDDHIPPTKYHNRLLTKADISEFWPDSKTIREYEAEQASR